MVAQRGSGQAMMSPPGFFTMNEWQHIAVTFNGKRNEVER
jgi:hypothetical protein